MVRYGETGAAEFLIRFRTEILDGTQAPADVADCPLTDADRESLAAARESGGGGGALGEKGELVDRIQMALVNAIGPVEVERVEYVGPRVGAELRLDGLRAIGIASLLVLAYIAFRFSTRYAPGAIVALLHDVADHRGHLRDLRDGVRPAGARGTARDSRLQPERHHHHLRPHPREHGGAHQAATWWRCLNLSVNQTLSRSILTSGTTLVAVMALLFVGGEVIGPFAIAMSIGIVVGTYSSVYIAAPTLLFLEQRLGDSGRPSRSSADRARAAGAAGAADLGGSRRPGPWPGQQQSLCVRSS